MRERLGKRRVPQSPVRVAIRVDKLAPETEIEIRRDIVGSYRLVFPLDRTRSAVVTTPSDKALFHGYSSGWIVFNCARIAFLTRTSTWWMTSVKVDAISAFHSYSSQAESWSPSAASRNGLNRAFDTHSIFRSTNHLQTLAGVNAWDLLLSLPSCYGDEQTVQMVSPFAVGPS